MIAASIHTPKLDLHIEPNKSSWRCRHLCSGWWHKIVVPKVILHSFFSSYLLFQSSTLIHFDSPSLQAIPELIFCKILPAKDWKTRSLRLAVRWVAFKRRLPAIAMPAMPLVSWWAVPSCDRFRYPNDLRIYPFQWIWKNHQIIPNGYLKLRKSENPANFFKNLLGIPVCFFPS